MMEGFGVHTFRLVNDAGDTSLVKFHWKPVLGVHGLVWEEALTLNGVDPDFHRRDLYNAIGAGAFPQWELGVQVMPDTEDQYFEGIDLLDATKLVPEELAPVQTIGTLTLNRRPEQLLRRGGAGGLPRRPPRRGIEVVDDPLMQAGLFSYLDTQLTRLGGPNFDQLPINRPHAPVDDLSRDGFSQQAVHEGRTPYLPNGVGEGCPFLAPDEDGGYIHVPRAVDGPKVRERPDDPYAQATLFWNSMTPVEQDHIVDAYTFELAKVEVLGVVKRMLRRLVHVAPRPGHPGRLRPRPHARELPRGRARGGPPPRRTRRQRRPDRVARPRHGHRGPLPARRTGGADPRRRRRRPRRPQGGTRRHRGGGSGPTWSLPARATSPATQGRPLLVDRSFHTASAAEADASSWPRAPVWPTIPAPSPTCRRPSATTSPSRPGATARSSSPRRHRDGRTRRGHLRAGHEGVRQARSSMPWRSTGTGSARPSTRPCTSSARRPDMPNGIDLVLADHQPSLAVRRVRVDRRGRSGRPDHRPARRPRRRRAAALYPLAAIVARLRRPPRSVSARPLGRQAADRPPQGPGGPALRGRRGRAAGAGRGPRGRRGEEPPPALREAATDRQLDELGGRILQLKQRVG